MGYFAQDPTPTLYKNPKYGFTTRLAKTDTGIGWALRGACAATIDNWIIGYQITYGWLM